MPGDGKLTSKYLLWGKEGLGLSVYEAALARVEYAYDEFDHVWVSFSGGKDSTVVLNVALEVARRRDALPLRVIFFDEECISYETEEYARRVAVLPDVAFEWYCLPVLHRNGCSKDSPNWWPWAPEDEALWVRPLPPEAITSLAGFPTEPPDARLSIPQACPLVCPVNEYGKSAGLLGIRADESLTRRKAIANKRPDNFIVPGGAPHYQKVYPIYDWRTEDVWTAPAKLGWDYNSTYDVFEMAGISHSSQRCAPPFGEEPMQQLWMWAECFPELWEKMCERVPGAAAARRYSRTELYSFGERVEKPDGVTWQKFIADRVRQHDPSVQAFIAHKIETSIRRHYRKTTDPIMPTARHPVSGISWEWLYGYADRGDFKDRRQMMELTSPSHADKARVAYEAERALVEGMT